MKFLIDATPKRVVELHNRFPELVAGQLVTPLTSANHWGGTFAIDNGAFSRLDRKSYFRILDKYFPKIESCLFAAVPDIVGNHRRTSELFGILTQEQSLKRYAKKWAFVLQDGCEDSHIIWREIRTVFIGGTDDFKNSQAAIDCVKAAKALGIFVHVGRVNTAKRFKRFAAAGADTCDGSGISRYDHMFETLKKRIDYDDPQLTFLEN